jgi:hypothetical protein
MILHRTPVEGYLNEIAEPHSEVSPMNWKDLSKQKYGLAVIFALLGIVIMLYQNRNGPAVGGDSVQYIIGARNLLDGNGYSRISGGGEVIPITGFPPFFSSVLAVLGLLGLDLIDGASYLNAFLFGGSLFLAGLLIHRATESVWATTIGSTLFLSSISLLKFHGMLMSEPLFIFLMMLTIYGLVRYLDTYQPLLLIGIAILTGAGILTRYVALSLTATGVLSIILFSTTNWRRRVLDCVLFGGISLAPLVYWFRRNSTVGESLTNRVLAFHLMRSDILRSYFAEVLSWFVPRVLGLSRPLRNLLVVLLAIPAPLFFVIHELRMGLLRERDKRGAIWYLPWILIIYVVSFLGILILNSTLLDAGTTLGAVPRYLTPVFISAVIFFVIVGHRLTTRRQPWSAPGIVFVAYGLFLVLLYGIQAYPQITQPDLIYLDYMRKRPGVVDVLSSINPDVAVITNNQEMVYLMSERPSYMWPIHFDQYRQEEREDYQAQLDATIEKLDNGGVLLVFGWPVGTEELVFDILNTQRLESFIDATFLGYPEAQPD